MTVGEQPYYSEHLAIRLFYCKALDTHHRVLCGFFDVYQYGDDNFYSTIAVHPKYRGQDIGKDLLLAAKEVVCDEWGETLIYNVEVENKKSRHVIESCGGELIEEWHGYNDEPMLKFALKPKS